MSKKDKTSLSAILLCLPFLTNAIVRGDTAWTNAWVVLTIVFIVAFVLAGDSK